MKKILILSFFILCAITQITAQVQPRIGLINKDTTTRPKALMGALAWTDNNLFLVKPTGNTVKFLQNDQRLWVGANNKVGVNTQNPTVQFEVAGDAKLSGDLYFNGSGTSLSAQLSQKLSTFTGTGFVKVFNGGVFYDNTTYIAGNTAITGTTNTKITYDSKGLITSSTTLLASDIPNISESQVTNLTTNLNNKLSTSTANSTYMPFSGGIFTSATETRKATAYNTSEFLQKWGGLGSSFGTMQSGDYLGVQQSNVLGNATYELIPYRNSVAQTRLTFSGNNIGIGKSNPSVTLDVGGGFKTNDATISSTYPLLTFQNNGISKYYTGLSAGSNVLITGSLVDDVIHRSTGGKMMFSTNNGNSSSLTILPNGNTGLGNNSPSEKLQVSGNALLDGVSPVLKYNESGVGAFSTGIFGTTINNSRYSIYSFNSGEALSVNYLNSFVGIGKTVPTTPLDVAGNGYHVPIARFSPAGASQSIGLGVESSGANFGASIFQNNVKVFTAESNGGILVGSGFQESNAPENGALIQGNVGVGTFAPTEKLVISGSGNETIKIESSTNANWRGIKFGNQSDTHGSIRQRLDTGEQRYEVGFSGWGGYQTFYTNGLERLRITDNGRIEVNYSIKLKGYTTAEINALSSPVEGTEVWNSDLKLKCIYNGTSWQRVTTSAM